MNHQPEKIIVASMNERRTMQWTQKKKKRLPELSLIYLAAAVFCLSVGAYAFGKNPQEDESVLSVMTTGFEYDETLGRLQYVSNILPESAMVFLSSDGQLPRFTEPCDGEILHTWSQTEPWLEYHDADSVTACHAGEVMNVVKNRQNEYTVRVMHQDGYESIYSGLTEVLVRENDTVNSGENIGRTDSAMSFEMRKDSLSVLPQFSTEGEMD